METTLMKPFASFWLAAGESGYATADDWRSWADTQILASENGDLPEWLIALSLAKSAAELRRILYKAVDIEVQRGFDRPLIEEAILGYWWLRFRRGDVDLRTCLVRAGLHADACQTSMDCEVFYNLLTRLEEDEVSGSLVEREADTLFLPLADIARKQWLSLLGPN